MPSMLKYEQCCEVKGCLAPARDYGLCTRCYLGLTPFERKVVRDCYTQPTEEIDAVAVAECVGLEAALLLEWDETARPAA